MQQTPRLTPQLCMQRDDLQNLPPIMLPEGYTLRTSREGDGQHWALILNETFGGERTAESFAQEMAGHYAYRPDRIFFICDPDGIPCATAGAYRMERWGESVGYVHYVAATRPSHAGKKLGYYVSLAVLHKFKEEGCACAVLDTDDFRTPALKTYLRLGFHPLIVHENQHERWQIIYRGLNLPLPEQFPVLG